MSRPQSPPSGLPMLAIPLALINVAIWLHVLTQLARCF